MKVFRHLSKAEIKNVVPIEFFKGKGGSRVLLLLDVDGQLLMDGATRNFVMVPYPVTRISSVLYST